MSVEKRIIKVGRRARGTGEAGSWAGIPHTVRGIGYEGMGNAAALADMDPTNVVQDSSYEIQAASKRHTEGPITCVAIAPDSPIESCDLYIDGNQGSNMHRVGVGCPFYGPISQDAHVYVTPTRTIPLIHMDADGAEDAASFRHDNIVWDCELAIDVDVGIKTLVSPIVPLKLEIYRGQFPPPCIRRAQYSASMAWAVKTAGAPEIVPFLPGLFLITDGRRRIRVVAATNNNDVGCNMKVWGVESLKDVFNTVARGVDDKLPFARQDQVLFDELLAATQVTQRPTPLIFDYMGNPYFAIYVQFSGLDGSHGHVDIHAWDE